uniref:DUF1684 domain-containing protein n=1 Tax=Roseihalotalea indica TaxID=2867963 RepID=A0AA49GQ99_9BACT|nr:DUF1684 domain-containing protein [Tunicatimonas sp. TK19036]
MNKIILGVVGLVIVGIMVYSLQGGESAEDYSERIAQERQRIRTYLRSAPDSPFAPDSIPFHELSYYEAKPEYRVTARLERVEDHKLLTLPTTSGEDEKYIRYGYAQFDLGGQPQRLLVLQPFDQEESTLFVAFADATSGEETYGGGRYLNVEMPSRTGQKTLELDFNLAYNPYCAYNPTFSCPFPPRENVMEIPVEAGEKTFEDK